MFKDWTWQKWVGKLILLAVAAGELVIKELGVNIPLWSIIVPAATWVAQFILSLIPAPPA
jgi:hypothetical protein